MEFWEVIRTRRSVRSYLDKDVPESVVRKVLSAAKWAPSSCNEQLWKFVVVRDKDKLERLVSEGGVSRLVLNPPLTIFVFYHSSPFPQNIQSASAAVQNILLAARNEGLGTCWIGGSGNHGKIMSILGVPGNYMFVCQILMGYPKGDTKAPAKKDVEEIMSMESFHGDVPLNTHDPERWSLSQIREHQKFFSSKTSPGREMAVFSEEEKSFVSEALSGSYREGRIIDLLSYDGSLLGCFPARPVSAELSEETARYVRSAGKSVPVVIGDSSLRGGSASLVTILFKLEGLPRKEFGPLFREARRLLRDGGKLMIIYRKSRSLYGLTHGLVRKFFGDDIRRSGIFTYFGPHRPISDPSRELREMGFSVKSGSHYIFPPVIEEYYYLAKQYRNAGNTYLDSEKKMTVIGRVLGSVARATKHVGMFGSIGVIVAEKAEVTKSI